MRRVVVLPERGKLIVATDLQGNVADFDRVAEIYEDAARKRDGAILVITGDLVHGPELPESQWPDYLGTYYHGDSGEVLTRARALADRHPGRVHYLLGNHEHAHVGGPIVSKFFPDEARRLEDILGPHGTQAMRDWLRTWPFVAFAPRAGLVMLHAAPHARIERRDDLERLPLDGFFDVPLEEMSTRGTLGALLWARTTSTERANAFLRAIDPTARVAVYGHDVARSGYAIDREPLLCISTSFGCYDGDKLYLEWDLDEPADSAADVATRGLRQLYPSAPTVYRIG
ncbi:metallophosphoesterase [Chondromyces apiculatus]|uniref:metallophosphoesterase n=1 Tax=Chondromyces apiculatus TaxID=51 RepID=UPI001E33A907|nr:metallophosphoesterase [Chondromyces apiculatus]